MCHCETSSGINQLNFPIYIERNALLSILKRACCGVIEAVAFYRFFCCFDSIDNSICRDWYNPEIDVSGWLLISFVSMLGLFPTVILMSIAANGIVIGRFKAVITRYGDCYIRFWFVSRIMDLVPTRLMRELHFCDGIADY